MTNFTLVLDPEEDSTLIAFLFVQEDPLKTLKDALRLYCSTKELFIEIGEQLGLVARRLAQLATAEAVVPSAAIVQSNKNLDSIVDRFRSTGRQS